MSHTVVGIFDSEVEAQEAKGYLVSNGFNQSDVDINTAGVAADDTLDERVESSAMGVNTGNTGYAGGIQPEQEHNDSIGGFFRSLFSGSDDEDQMVNRHTAAGSRGVIVTVHTKSAEQAELAADILDDHGAIDVNDRDTESGYKAKDGYATPTPAGSTGKIDVMEETLNVGKREVETGGVRLRSRIVERPVEESIRLRQEKVTVNRTPVNKTATDADFAAFKEGTVEMKEHAERAVVAKEARVVEEVSLNKQVSEKEETIRDTVRHTEVDVDDIDSSNKL